MAQILVVDDDAQVREVLRRHLEPAGHTVTEAATAEEGMQHVQADRPDVAVCDMHMPGANGLWLADQIRTVAPATAIILATGDTSLPAGETLRPGVVAYLVKPLKR